MTNKRRWQQLAGILTESVNLTEGVDKTKVYKQAAAIENNTDYFRRAAFTDIGAMVDDIRDPDPDFGKEARSLRAQYYDGWSDEEIIELYKMLGGDSDDLSEASTLPVTNDSLDGPYTELEDEQPMDVDKNINRELVEQEKLADVSPESMSPSREDEEEAMAASRGEGSKYPATAEEYAKQLNAERSDSPFQLADDAEHWAEYDIHTGEELAKYLMASEIWDMYKEMYGIRPRFMDPFKMSIKDLESQLKRLRMEWEEMVEEDEQMISVADYEEKEEYEDHPRELEYDAGAGKYEDLEADWDEKLYGKR